MSYLRIERVDQAVSLCALTTSSLQEDKDNSAREGKTPAADTFGDGERGIARAQVVYAGHRGFVCGMLRPAERGPNAQHFEENSPAILLWIEFIPKWYILSQWAAWGGLDRSRPDPEGKSGGPRYVR